MKTAIISFDPNIVEEFKNKLGDANVRIYIDSISMLKELEDFKPKFIVYDASAGDFAFDDLKFLLSRDKVKGIKFKVLYSKEQPIEDSEILSQDIDIYEKNTELYKVIDDILEEHKKQKLEEESFVLENTTQPTQETFDLDMDMSSQLQETINSTSPEEVEQMYFQNTIEENFQNDYEFSMEDTNASTNFENKKSKNQVLEENLETARGEKYTLDKNKYSDGITLKISKDEIESAIVNVAVDKLVSMLKNDEEIKAIFENIKVDFINKLNEEIETLKEELSQEIRTNLFKKVENEIMHKLNNELKDYIAEQIALIIKEKINQAFK